jgi:hypothetical protein
LARARNDSLLAVLRSDAQIARARAQGAGASADDLRDGEGLYANAELLARNSRYADATSRFRDAMTAWGRAEQAAKARAAQLATQPRVENPAPVPPPPPAPPTAPAAPSAAQVRQAVTDAVQAYATALQSRNIAQIRQAYPGLTGAQETGWRDFFQVAQNLRVVLGVTDVQQQGIDAAEATVAGTYEYRDSQSRRDQHQSVSFRVSLERGGGGWRITAIR